MLPQWQPSGNNGCQEESFMARRGGHSRAGKRGKNREKGPQCRPTSKRKAPFPLKSSDWLASRHHAKGVDSHLHLLKQSVKRINQHQLKASYPQNPKQRQPNYARVFATVKNDKTCALLQLFFGGKTDVSKTIWWKKTWVGRSTTAAAPTNCIKSWKVQLQLLHR